MVVSIYIRLCYHAIAAAICAMGNNKRNTEGGVSLHQITSGIDEGPIIDQKLVTIEVMMIG